MKAKCALTLTAVVLAAGLQGAWGHESKADVMVRVQGVAPIEDGDWDSGTGLEAQLRFWGSDHVGLSLALGAASWDAVGEYVEEWDEVSYYSSIVDGDASLLRVGASLWARSPLSRHTALTVEAGVRYLSIDSSIDTSVYYEEGADVFSSDDVIEIDDAWLATVGIYLEAEMANHVSIQAGLGYDFDLTGPGETVLGESIGDTSFSGLLFGVGIAVGF